MARVRVNPVAFEYVDYDADVIATLAEELASRVGVPDDVEVRIEVDEELPLPLTGSTAEIVDGRAELWFSGANFEDGRHRAHFAEPVARVELATTLLRAADRLEPGFASAPADEDLSDGQRVAWEAWAEGRAARLGELGRKVRRRYMFRLYNGFTDTADAAFELLWRGGSFAWADLEAICAECAVVDPRPPAKERSAIRRDSLRPQG